MMRDLVLELRGEQCVRVILPNINGQKYVFGPFYPGERGGEEFIFIRDWKGILDPTQTPGAIISVDDQGQYWIQNDTRIVERRTTRSSVYNMFVNNDRVKAVETRLIKSGDMISFGDQAGPGRHPNLCVYVAERTFGDSRLQTDSDNAADPSVPTFADSPLTNNLILEKIMSYLPLEDLKSARLVCKKWKEEASKPLEKKGAVSFTFNSDYLNPEKSTRVFRYLHEMRDLKMRNLHISHCSWYCQSTFLFTPKEHGDRMMMMDDLRNLLNSSHNFSTLFLRADIRQESDFLQFATIFQELGETLVELKLGIYNIFIPAVVPPFPPMRNLKKLTQSFDGERALAAQLVPLFSNNLEHFTCDGHTAFLGHTAVPYLEEFLKHPMPYLKGMELKETARGKTLSRLLELETPLTFLKIKYCKACSEPADLLERLLLKHSPSLRTLVIRIGYCIEGRRSMEVKFPSFPMLQELELEYGRTARICWEADFDYGKHFPSLRKLTVRPQERWNNDDPIFNAFFPEEGNLACQTVEEVWIPVMPNDSFEPRMGRIRNMFPKAEKMNFLQ